MCFGRELPLSTNLFVHVNHSWTKSSLHLSSECLINFTTGLLFTIRTAVFLVVLIITSFLIFTFSIMWFFLSSHADYLYWNIKNDTVFMSNSSGSTGQYLTLVTVAWSNKGNITWTDGRRKVIQVATVLAAYSLVRQPGLQVSIFSLFQTHWPTIVFIFFTRHSGKWSYKCKI